MRNKTTKTRTCQICGATYVPNGQRQKACVPCGPALKKAYWGARKPKTAEYNRAYKQAHRAERNEDSRARRKTPEGRAYHFLKMFPDCTSSREEIAAAYAAGRHVISGKPGEIGQAWNNLVMDHVKNGPIVGLVWAWENRSMSERLVENSEEFTKVLALHNEVAQRKSL